MYMSTQKTLLWQAALEVITDRDLAWVAGILEGEGSFGNYTTPVIQLMMSDSDVVARVGKVMGVSTKVPWQRPGRPETKLMYRIYISGDAAIAWMKRLRPEMGARRQAKIDEIISQWYPPVRKLKGPASCHPDRSIKSKGLCRACYEQQRLTSQKEVPLGF